MLLHPLAPAYRPKMVVTFCDSATLGERFPRLKIKVKVLNISIAMEAADPLGSGALTLERKYLLLTSQPFFVFLSSWGMAQGGKEEGGLARRPSIYKLKS